MEFEQMYISCDACNICTGDVCEITRGPCKAVEKLLPNGWPAFLQCSQPYFNKACKVAVKAPFSNMQKSRIETCY